MKEAHFLYLEILIECNDKFKIIWQLTNPFTIALKLRNF